MIRNERQYRAIQTQRRRLLETRAGYSAAPQKDPLAQSALVASVDWLLDDVEAEISAYESLRNGEKGHIIADGLTELPDLLVQARIASGLTQRALAERLGVPEEAVQRDEAGGYARAGLDRLARIADLLGVRLRLTGSLAPIDQSAQ